MVEEQLHSFVVFSTVQGDIRAQMRQKSLRLLPCRPTDTLIELGCIGLKIFHVLIGPFKVFLSSFVVFHEKFE